MDIYFFVCILMIIIQFLPLKKRNWNLIISLTLLFFFGAFRENFGNDYFNYQEYFKSVHLYGKNSNDRFELGFFLLAKFIPTWRLFISISSLFTCLTLYYFIKHVIPSKFWWLFFVLFMFAGDKITYFQFSGLRNAFSINIFILTIIYILYNTPKKWILIYSLSLCLAYSFHNSSLLFYGIAFPFMFNWKVKGYRGFLVSSIFLGILYLLNDGSLITYSKTITDLYFDKYSVYLESSNLNHRQSIPMLLFIFSYIGLAIYTMNRYSNNDKEEKILRLSLAYIVGLCLGPLALRLSQCYILFLISSPIIVLQNRTILKPVKIVFICIVLLFIIYSFFVIWLNNPYFVYHTYNYNFNLI